MTATARKLAGAIVGGAGLLALLYLLSPLLLRLATPADCDVFSRVPGADSAVALTLDDGPHPATTRAILRVLHRHDARATFFLIGSRAARHPDLARAVVEAGHEVGNHMWRDRTSVTLDSAAFEEALLRAGEVLSYVDGRRWLRPGGGRYDETMVSVARAHGYRMVLADVYPVDTVVRWPWLLAQFVRAWSRPGSVLVLHDGPGRGERTVRVLERVLPALAARGLEVVTVSELAARRGEPDGAGSCPRGRTTDGGP